MSWLAFIFFFSSRRRHTRWPRDWSSDVCSSDLYKTMTGHHVERKAGWDTHGLPVEIAVEQKLGFTSKDDIERYGIAEFNRQCREAVLEHLEDWRALTERIGYWVDLDDAYYTLDPAYVESVWWALKTMWDRDLL